MRCTLICVSQFYLASVSAIVKFDFKFTTPALKRTRRAQIAWKVPMTKLSVFLLPIMEYNRFFISFAALLVNVTTIIC